MSVMILAHWFFIIEKNVINYLLKYSTIYTMSTFTSNLKRMSFNKLKNEQLQKISGIFVVLIVYISEKIENHINFYRYVIVVMTSSFLNSGNFNKC